MSTSSPFSLSILEREIRRLVTSEERSYQNARPDKLHPPSSGFRVGLPSKFRERRALVIASWFLPDWLKFEIQLQFLTEGIYSLDWNNKGLEQSLELALYANSLEDMLLSLQKEVWITKRVLFGTVLKEDLKNALSSLRIILPKTAPPKRKVRRKGYQDKGTWRPPHRWLPSSGYLDKLEWYRREKCKLIFDLIFQTYQYKLRQER